MDTPRDKEVIDNLLKEKNKMKIFLTGGSGFIGKVFIKEALKRKHFIYAITRKIMKKKRLKI